MTLYATGTQDFQILVNASNKADLPFSIIETGVTVTDAKTVASDIKHIFNLETILLQ